MTCRLTAHGWICNAGTVLGSACCRVVLTGPVSSMQAYRTWLGFYKGFMKLCRWNSEQLVQAANRYAGTLGVHPFFSCGTQTCCSILQNVFIPCLRLTGSCMSLHL